MPQHKPLAEYVEKACAFQYNTSTRPFNSGTALNPPCLRPRGVNRILLYPGSFNPPHRGHVDLLTHVYHNAGDDLHIVAAIIIPIDDYKLRNKTANEENSIVLDKEQRAKLWNGDGMTMDWAWVFDKSEGDWFNFRADLMDTVKAEGIDLKFILLAGPDRVGVQTMGNFSSWGCVDAITSNISRPVDFTYPSSLRQLSGYSDWQRPICNELRLEGKVRAKMGDQPEEEIKKAIQTSIDQVRRVWVCHRSRKPKGFIRFVPAEQPGPSQPPSSSQIRKLIESHFEKLEKELGKTALNPSLLAHYMRGGDSGQDMRSVIEAKNEAVPWGLGPKIEW